MKNGFRRGGRGFTLIELLVVIAIIGILAALLFPAVQGALVRTNATKVGQDGRSIWLGLYSKNTECQANGEPEVWPKDTGTTSTAYFQMCMYSNWLEGFSMTQFGAPGVVSYTSTNISGFAEVNNAWCVTLGVDENTLPEVPFLFTKNWDYDSQAINDVKGLNENKPFGVKVGVFVTAGGGVRTARGSDMKDKAGAQRRFNPLSKDNQFLIP